ncbi:MAG: CDP-alcohol phosphatidyltransferase family protein [Phycisphaerae bacterium]|nr:CDP-alcohol phosphatidyltransferase family protein [Phycisphaerae bacterium]
MPQHMPEESDTSAENPPETKDFRAWRDSGEAAGASKSIGSAIAAARDGVAQVLVRLGATPNRITVVGFLFTCVAGYCLARGASQQVPYFVVHEGPVGWWPVLAAVFLLLAGACDMLDGAVARLAHLSSRSGALLDSSVDRFSDMALCIGCFLHFALLDQPSITYQLLAVFALCNAVLISYLKARAENVIADCSVGYWLRGERFAAVLIGCLSGHVPAVLWQLAISCAFTVWRRLSYAFLAIRAADADRPPPTRGPWPGWLGRFQLWRHPRGSVAYDLVTGTHIAYIVAAPCLWPVLLAVEEHADPLRRWLLDS